MGNLFSPTQAQNQQLSPVQMGQMLNQYSGPENQYMNPTNVLELPSHTTVIPSHYPTANVYPPTPTAAQEATPAGVFGSPFQQAWTATDLATGGLGPLMAPLIAAQMGWEHGAAQPTGEMPVGTEASAARGSIMPAVRDTQFDTPFGAEAYSTKGLEDTYPNLTPGDLVPRTEYLGGRGMTLPLNFERSNYGLDASKIPPTGVLNPKTEYPFYSEGEPPTWLYHGLGVSNYDLRAPRNVAMADQRDLLRLISKEGLSSGWFSDYPLAGYGPVHLAVKTEDLPKGSWGNPHAQGFKAAGEARFHTYRPWDPEDIETEEYGAPLDRELMQSVHPSKIHLADAQGNIVAPLIDSNGKIHPLAEDWLNKRQQNLTGMLYPGKRERAISGGMPTRLLTPEESEVGRQQLAAMIGKPEDMGASILHDNIVSDLMSGAYKPADMIKHLEDAIKSPQTTQQYKLTLKSIIGSMKKYLPDIEGFLEDAVPEEL